MKPDDRPDLEAIGKDAGGFLPADAAPTVEDAGAFSGPFVTAMRLVSVWALSVGTGIAAVVIARIG